MEVLPCFLCPKPARKAAASRTHSKGPSWPTMAAALPYPPVVHSDFLSKTGHHLLDPRGFYARLKQRLGQIAQEPVPLLFQLDKLPGNDRSLLLICNHKLTCLLCSQLRSSFLERRFGAVIR